MSTKIAMMYETIFDPEERSMSYTSEVADKSIAS